MEAQTGIAWRTGRGAFARQLRDSASAHLLRMVGLLERWEVGNLTGIDVERAARFSQDRGCIKALRPYLMLLMRGRSPC